MNLPASISMRYVVLWFRTLAVVKSVARLLNVEEETCDMHDGDKIGRSAIGELLRKDGSGGFINPFEPGELIVVFYFIFLFC